MALTDIAIRKMQHSGKGAGDKHADGQGMYLLVKTSGKYWRMNYRFEGKHKTLALGVYPGVSLAGARAARTEARAQLAQGIDPAATRQEAKRAPDPDAEHTFKSVAEDWLARTAGDRAPKTKQKIEGWLQADIYPALGAMPVAALRPRDVLTMLRKVEERGALDSAGRMLQLCGQILRFAIASTLIEVDVTSGLRGALTTPVTKHYAAITEPARVGALLRAIEGYEGHHSVVGALNLAPLVFVRPGELRAAEWAEFDLDAAEWRIPGVKMKMEQDHIVPLSAQALLILRRIEPLTSGSRFVFPGLRSSSKCISDAAVNAALRALGYSKDVMTGHGFRATARTIMDEVMGERVDLIEHQLAHAVKDVNGRAYNRTAHLPARREMMQRWADKLDQLRRGAEVVAIR
jgi:integrase